MLVGFYSNSFSKSQSINWLIANKLSLNIRKSNSVIFRPRPSYQLIHCFRMHKLCQISRCAYWLKSLVKYHITHTTSKISSKTIMVLLPAWDTLSFSRNGIKIWYSLLCEICQMSKNNFKINVHDTFIYTPNTFRRKWLYWFTIFNPI